jgi:hypothetical protein
MLRIPTTFSALCFLESISSTCILLTYLAFCPYTLSECKLYEGGVLPTFVSSPTYMPREVHFINIYWMNECRSIKKSGETEGQVYLAH